MVTDITTYTDHTWCLLWSHTARQVVASLANDANVEVVYAGHGWGLKNLDNQRALLIHPTADNRELGELSLTVRGEGTQIIPRCDASFTSYVDAVADAVETVARSYIFS